MQPYSNCGLYAKKYNLSVQFLLTSAALKEFDKGVLRKGIERIRVFGEGQIEVVWKGGDMFGGGDS